MLTINGFAVYGYSTGYSPLPINGSHGFAKYDNDVTNKASFLTVPAEFFPLPK